jgi:hypothetical protein
LGPTNEAATIGGLTSNPSSSALPPPTRSSPRITTISANPTQTPMLRCTTGATIWEPPIVLSKRKGRVLALLAWRAGSCLTWLLTASPTCADSAVIFCPSLGQGKPPRPVADLSAGVRASWLS